MKQIIPFKKEITFKTMISNITSISLEHTLELKDDNNISGDFIVSGSYKMTEASQIDEEFSYKVPIEITIDDKYDTSNVSLEIDDFVYEVIDEEKLLLNIDLCIDHLELIKIEEQKEEVIETISSYDEYKDIDNTLQEVKENIESHEKFLDKELVRGGTDDSADNTQRRDSDLFLDNSKEEQLEIPIDVDSVVANNQDIKPSYLPNNVNSNNNNDNGESNPVSSIFSAFKDTDETFSTYCIYIIREGDSLDTVINKYKTTRDILAEYNDLSDIRIGTKIIVPTSNE